MKLVPLASVLLVGLILAATAFFFDSSANFTTPIPHQLFQK
jgi:hypothetical protein